MPAFVDAVDLPICKGVLTDGQYDYSCGLYLAEANVTRFGPKHWRVQPRLFRAAHRIHHNATTGHNPIASLSYRSKDSKVLSATCTCLFDFNA